MFIFPNLFIKEHSQSYTTVFHSYFTTLRPDFSVGQLFQSAVKVNRVWILNIAVAEEY